MWQTGQSAGANSILTVPQDQPEVLVRMENVCSVLATVSLRERLLTKCVTTFHKTKWKEALLLQMSIDFTKVVLPLEVGWCLA